MMKNPPKKEEKIFLNYFIEPLKKHFEITDELMPSYADILVPRTDFKDLEKDYPDWNKLKFLKLLKRLQRVDLIYFSALRWRVNLILNDYKILLKAHCIYNLNYSLAEFDAWWEKYLGHVEEYKK